MTDYKKYQKQPIKASMKVETPEEEKVEKVETPEVEKVETPEVEKVEKVETPEVEKVETPEEVVKDTIEQSTIVKEMKVVGCSKLNIRSGTSITSKILCIVDSGTKLLVRLDDKENDGWVGVSCPNGIEGFCIKEFLSN